MMNEYQSTLYSDLIKLCATNEAFYFQDFDTEGRKFRIFNYRIASYTDFLHPSALECRGHMFEIDDNAQAIRLAALPMSKFFNISENPITMNLDYTTVVAIENKADGSLISSYLADSMLKLKSKGSLSSDQATDAMAWLDLPSNDVFKATINMMESLGYTVNMEWVGLQNRIVVGYPVTKLIVLNIRNKIDGSYIDPTLHFDSDYLIETVDTKGLDLVEFVESIPDMQDDIEGYIIKLASGQFVKIKTKKYMSLHHAKDSINNPRRLFEAVVDEGVDDLRSLFHSDELAMKLIDEMQDHVTRLYNHMVKVVETFYGDNKQLDRKSFAIKGQSELEQMHFGLVMNKYTQKPIDYKTFIKSRWKELGFKDTAQVV